MHHNASDLQARLRSALKRHSDGGNLTVGFIGGSVTAGDGKNDGQSFAEWTYLALQANIGSRVAVSMTLCLHQIMSIISILNMYARRPWSDVVCMCAIHVLIILILKQLEKLGLRYTQMIITHVTPKQ